VRWVEREEFVSPEWEPTTLDIPQAAPGAGDGKLRLGTYRPLWAAKEVDVSPALHFIRARQVAELSPSDAAALGINEGDRIEVGNGTRVRAQVKLREAIPAGSVFLAEGTREDNSNVLLAGGLVEITRIGPGPVEPSAVPAQIQPAVEGLAEMPPSAPLPIPPREAT
jgi:NADH-quinone oxidoreductase subunit G